MRVLFVTGEFPPMQGGVGDCTNEIAIALVVLGVETHVLTTDDRLGTTDDKTPSAIRHPPSAIQIHRLVPKWNWNSISILRRVLDETRADIVHIQYQTAAFGMHPAINLTPRALNFATFTPSPNRRGQRGVRFITTFHDLKVPYLFPKAGRLREWITFALARASDTVIATNEEDKARLEGKLRKSVELIPIGSNIPPTAPPNFDRAAWRGRLGITPADILLSYFGFLNESKGANDLVRALAHVPNAKLIMVGGQVGASDPTNLAYLAQVKNLIKALNLSSRVIWTDYTAPTIVSANLLASDICVLPYRDGMSFRRGSFMAALAHGLPIVTTPPSPVQMGEGVTRQYAPRRGVSPPWRLRSLRAAGQGLSVLARQGVGVSLQEGENVLLVPPENPTALADAIIRLVASPELRTRLSEGARELAQNFTWDKIAAQHLELYRRVMVKSSDSLVV